MRIVMPMPDQPRKLFRKVLVANRGEIAVRVIRALRENEYSERGVFSEADRAALHVQMADEAVCVGPARVARELSFGEQHPRSRAPHRTPKRFIPVMVF